MKRIEDKFSDLKVGDIVVTHEPDSKRTKPYECVVTKIGNKFIHVDTGYGRLEKFSRERGFGEYGMEIYPGNMSECTEWKETGEEWCNLVNELYRKSGRKNFPSRDQIERIKAILRENDIYGLF